MNPITVLLVDDHQIVRQGLRSILEPDPNFKVVGEAATGAEALSIVKSKQPGIAVLDLKLPDMTGAELCRHIVSVSPNTVVIILTAYFEHDVVCACLRAGARGYLIKDAEQLNLPEQLRAALHGHTTLDPRVTDILADYMRHGESPADNLTNREMEVISLIGQGLTNREIAVQLQLTENTVKGYVKEIFAKLGARNRVEAVALVRKRGLL
jgi:two-component system, NarL family, response regulator DevR